MTNDEFVLQGGFGTAIALAKGEGIEIVNTHGTQVLDTWAVSQADPTEVLSMEHTRSRLSVVAPRVNDDIYSTRRRPMLRLEKDTSPGIHDTLLCACSPEIYRELGVTEPHRSCEGNFHEALASVGVTLPTTPGPLNLFMNVAVAADGALVRGDPTSRPGDLVLLRAAFDLYLILSACPQDITPINGPDKTPRDVLLRRV